MPLKYLLLGLLSDEPRSGYALHKSFFGPLRPALSQIYRLLAEMADGGLVHFSKVEQEKLPAQKVYRVTEAGEADLDSWLRKPVRPSLHREAFLSQLWFSSRIDKENVINNIMAYADEVREQLEWYKTEARNIVEKAAESSNNPAGGFYWNTAIDCGVAQLEALLKWADDAIKKVSNFTPISGAGAD